MSTLSHRLFAVQVRARIALTPSLLRIVFCGPALSQLRSFGPDQRIKLFFPAADGQTPALRDGPDWYAHYRAIPVPLRPPMRTYTIRALRTEQAEVDVDFVLHGDTGPASQWASRACVGDALQLWGPCEGCDADSAGFEWRPPARARHLLIVADETALPAAACILEQLDAQAHPARVDALIELPHASDAGYPALRSGAFRQVQWLPRDRAAQCGHGEQLLRAVHATAFGAGLAQASARQAQAPVDVDREILWEQASDADAGSYAWIAGEAAAVLKIRRYLLSERGLDKRALTFMGYWRQGRALD
ncbi:siderophore-interacting protein [Xanthomonas hydrangeae]|uniref:Siderophore-interacting protein n=1 Tax=Xanthomonas hydrangeae TaxID=2775159 RepID=A0AAU0B5H4_9XANT|nr:siderophore-interacting protein [Xanthomonas hydrangeae]WOB48207.1 siderophore-interacting protein [Xanthomonas hydrangeae]